MTTSPDLVDVVDDIRAALVAIERELTPDINVVGYSQYTQSDFPYWTNRIYAAAPELVGTDVYSVTHECQCLYHVGPSTGGIDGETEIAAQRMMSQLSLLFAVRPLLESAAYPSGVEGLLGNDGSGGVVLGTASIVESTVNGVSTIAVAVPVSVPVRIFVETRY